AEALRFFEYRTEDRGEVAGRGVDDAQYLGGRGLLVEGLTRLGDKPHVFHRDDRLRREIFDGGDLFVREGPRLVPIEAKQPQDAIFPAKRHGENGLDTAEIGHRAGQRVAVAIEDRALEIDDVDRAFAVPLPLLHRVGPV